MTTLVKVVASPTAAEFETHLQDLIQAQLTEGFTINQLVVTPTATAWNAVIVFIRA